MAGALQKETEIITKGMIIAGVGFGLVLAREHDSRMDALLLRGSPIHDFIGLVMIFVSSSYLILFIPQWGFMLTVGTLIAYYTVINLHEKRT